jgi:hypothetical protein
MVPVDMSSLMQVEHTQQPADEFDYAVTNLKVRLDE